MNDQFGSVIKPYLQKPQYPESLILPSLKDLKYPASPQPVPQEFLNLQKFLFKTVASKGFNADWKYWIPSELAPVSKTQWPEFELEHEGITPLT